ncbi:hypothetical protein ACPOL_0252 [Acidisarcina polymorpha]|uniref:Uncharacterized protein n=1 Tax=Acidisarcina polymorpha TaxID=2211140 RepID=A0A2Z5FT25_9BACT|nr:hypothetical protein [Acidisarcina polymorpha]AXC09637.1 hypothetical protein ACPOL_0252 [Acidisarcina polymorpha]
MNNDIVPLPKSGCPFPAVQLRQYRAELIREVTHIEEFHLDADRRRRPYPDALLALDRLRLAHEEISECGCWYAPVKAAKEAA